MLDVEIVIDGSGSITEPNFAIQRQFIKDLVASFQVGPTTARFGLVQFSTEGTGRQELSLSGDSSAIVAAIDGLQQIRGVTDIEEGLTLGSTDLQAAGRPGIPSVVILLTDGIHNEPGDPIARADAIKAGGTPIFAVGVGDGIDPAELSRIASDPDGSFVFTAADFGSLGALVGSLSTNVCAAVMPPPPPVQPVEPPPTPTPTPPPPPVNGPDTPLPPMVASLGLGVGSDSGRSSTDGVTNVAAPMFVGRAGAAGAVVQIWARAAGAPAATLIGIGAAGPDGSFSIPTAAPLADGTYTITASTIGTAGVALATPLVIDTVGPRVVAATLVPFGPGFQVTFQDNLSGLDQSTLANPFNYALIQLNRSLAVQPYVLRAIPANPGAPTAPQDVVVALATPHGRLVNGSYVLRVGSNQIGVADRAGNLLDGEFAGRFPSGDTVRGGNFGAVFQVRGGRVGRNPTGLTPFQIVQAAAINPAFPIGLTTLRRSRHARPR